jgi:hypothetical protein
MQGVNPFLEWDFAELIALRLKATIVNIFN